MCACSSEALDADHMDPEHALREEAAIGPIVFVGFCCDFEMQFELYACFDRVKSALGFIVGSKSVVSEMKVVGARSLFLLSCFGPCGTPLVKQLPV
jgi:hypothetical protein